MKLSAIILAAGASSRMGQPKALLEYRGKTFLDHLAGTFAPHCEQVIVVLGYHADEIRAGVSSSPEFILNPHPESGQLSSLQWGMRAVDPSVDGVFFTPVDIPAFSTATVAALARRFDEQQALAPRYKGKHGHPVLIAARRIPDFLAATGSARDVIHSLAVEYVDVDDPGVRHDVDDAAAYAELTRGRA